MDRVGAVLAALGDTTRRGVVEVLAERPVSAGDIASRLDVTAALLTRHLRVLRDAGVVRASLDPSDNRRHVYELVPEPLIELRDWVEGVTAFWSRQLDSFASHAGKRARDGTRGERHARR